MVATPGISSQIRRREDVDPCVSIHRVFCSPCMLRQLMVMVSGLYKTILAYPVVSEVRSHGLETCTSLAVATRAPPNFECLKGL